MWRHTDLVKSNHLSKCHASILKQFVTLPVSDLLGANLRQPDIFIYFWAHFVSANRLSHKTMHHFYLNVKDTFWTLKKISAGSRIIFGFHPARERFFNIYFVLYFCLIISHPGWLRHIPVDVSVCIRLYYDELPEPPTATADYSSSFYSDANVEIYSSPLWHVHTAHRSEHWT